RGLEKESTHERRQKGGLKQPTYASATCHGRQAAQNSPPARWQRATAGWLRDQEDAT
ncbi:hypothetical protein HAX54_008518, partial [Datura stramonium]|nr:hypothetical protein [Datura stramonium]